MTTLTKPDAVRKQDQVASLQEELNDLRLQLRQAQKLATVGTMAAMVAHEFNNILTPIINYAQQAQHNPSLTQKAITYAATGGRRATDICNAILRLTSDAVTTAADVDLGELIHETLNAMAREPRQDGITLTVDMPAGMKITTRRVELQQVILNLLINARTAVLAKSGPRLIRIELSRSRGRVMLKVSDNGVGIPAENLDRIFMPFFSTRSPASREGNGHGLGLTICRDIVNGLGGQISVQSEPGNGATFTVSLPVVPKAALSRSPGKA